jgi:hypothetical protein
MTRIGRTAAVLIGLVAAIVPATSVFAATNGHTVYNSLAPAQGNIPSVGFEANQASEFGNQITLARSAKVATVEVTMSSWGCQTRPGGTCVTSPGSTFNEPITLNIFQAPATSPRTQPDTPGSGLPGVLIKSVTKTFAIPFRPSASSKCTGTEAGDWFYSKLGECFPGFMTNITFNLNVTLPVAIVYGIAYNTSDYGAAPYGVLTACHSSSAGCGYDSLNVGVSEDPDNVKVGADPFPGTVYWNTTTPDNYCDTGNAGSGTFRFDSPGSTPPCWGVTAPYSSAPWYVPSVKFSTAG